ncbi:DNA glycosylase [Xylaria nigripes]|nr:DNA glycosylase [Xylaria nigripes]
MRRSSRNAQRVRPTYADGDSEHAIAESATDDSENATRRTNRTRKRKSLKTPSLENGASRTDDNDNGYQEPKIEPKKRRVVRSAGRTNGQDHSHIQQRLFGSRKLTSDLTPCSLPERVHSIDYHRPLLLDNRRGRDALLKWFDGVSSLRSMPWRKPWIDPQIDAEDQSLLRQKLERRAYEVWISEIMLQQTRVAVVIDYWNRWMEKWPTIHDLAAAEPDDVLAAWRGLGYYSRATRIHDAAKLVCGDSLMNGLLPSAVDELVAKVPGVGRYTAGAISAIVFGKAAPMVDGNVLRVLSRQLAILGDVKSDKLVIDLLWAAADSLVKAIAKDSSDDGVPSALEQEVSDRPGRWGQALMELGSTICTPKPDCEVCPISASCRAYTEGLLLASTTGLAPNDMFRNFGQGSPPDIEDSCKFCKPFEEVAQDSANGDAESVPTPKKNTSQGKAKRVQRQTTLSTFITPSSKSKDGAKSAPTELSPAGIAIIVDHARKFPVKVIKKAVKEQETLVCAIRRSDGRYLIHRRPQKGLLAGLWEFPSWIVPEDHESTAAAYRRAAELFASGVLDPVLQSNSSKHPKLKYVGNLGSVPWLFSHLKLTMHVFLFELNCSQIELGSSPQTTARWSSSVEEESMGTGMRKCWDLVREANGE